MHLSTPYFLPQACARARRGQIVRANVEIEKMGDTRA